MKSIKGISILVIGVIVTLGAVYLLFSSNLFSREGDYETENSIPLEMDIIEPTLMYGMVVDSLHMTEGVVKRNQRFTDLLSDYYVSPEIYQQLHFVPRNIFDFRKIAVNKKYTLLSGRYSLKSATAIIYEPNAIDYIIFHLKDTLL
ncbi:MAG: peptidase M23, partial [Cyclobacteriaceae bacterium]